MDERMDTTVQLPDTTEADDDLNDRSSSKGKKFGLNGRKNSTVSPMKKPSQGKELKTPK